ncbi:AAA family ATPase [Chryseobacterium sp. JAH]|uniref:AAA family ATPase n=1 Tax=Chryseobacterium sp. JAH TaxID=1742858 RepID=UPI000A913E54|nr:AAA family ATPase [Chryseobacterium sp. JAH]
MCEKAGIEVIILDSISHCWDYLLDYHSSLAGNSFTNWAKIKPLEKLFMDKILQCNAHIITTMRTKQDYVLNQKDGKFIPEKVGLKSVQRDGLDYEFTLVFDVDIKHHVVSSKDRTGLFMGKPEFIISESTGSKILSWCSQGTSTHLQSTSQNTKIILSEREVFEHIQMCSSITELLDLYKSYPHYHNSLRPDFEARKTNLININNPNNINKNGHTKFQ